MRVSKQERVRTSGVGPTGRCNHWYSGIRRKRATVGDNPATADNEAHGALEIPVEVLREPADALSRSVRPAQVFPQPIASAVASPGVAVIAPSRATVSTSTGQRPTMVARELGPPAMIAVASTSAVSMSSATTVTCT